MTTSWRERLCGSLAVQGDEANEPVHNLDQVLKSSQHLSHGGGFLPTQNPAHLQTSTSVILPTEKYAVMILKTNGHAVIYSEDENIIHAADDDGDDELPSFDAGE